jgi:hypothetical protein
MVLMGVLMLLQSQTDFDLCNRQAASIVRAAPHPGRTPGPSVGGSTMTAPGGSDINRMPNASGRISGSPGSPGTDAGTSATGNIENAGTAAGRPPRPSAGTLSGMAPAGANHPAYQRAYRDCMARRGF